MRMPVEFPSDDFLADHVCASMAAQYNGAAPLLCQLNLPAGPLSYRDLLYLSGQHTSSYTVGVFSCSLLDDVRSVASLERERERE